MRAVLTIWNQRIAPVFDVAGQALLVVSEDGAAYTEEILMLTKSSALAKVASLADAQADVLICGAISRPARSAADTFGIKVHAFIAGSVCEVVQAWLGGRLDDSYFAMPGCGCKRSCCGKRIRGGGSGSAGRRIFERTAIGGLNRQGRFLTQEGSGRGKDE